MQTDEWNREFHNVSFLLEPGIARVRTDDGLRTYLKAGRNHARDLSDHIRRIYEERYQKALDISRQSLATEIVLHVRADSMLRFAERCAGALRMKKLSKKLRWYIDRTAVIDCGERAVDTNRVVFDLLSLVFRQQI